MELRYPNGYTGYLLDRNTIDVSQSKDFQLLRATAILAMASEMATATVHDGRDADTVADYLAAASDEVNYASAEIYPVEGAGPCATGEDVKSNTCTGYYQNFESDLPHLEGRIINVMIESLPQERSREFLSDVRKGDVFGAAIAALRTAYQSAVGLDRAAGAYRSSLELVATNATCLAGSFEPKHGTTFAALKCLGLPPYKIDHATSGLDERVGVSEADREYPLRALLAVAQASCARLPLPSDSDIATEVKRRNDACGRVTFKPKSRPVEVVDKSDTEVAGEKGTPSQPDQKQTTAH